MTSVAFCHYASFGSSLLKVKLLMAMAPCSEVYITMPCQAEIREIYQVVQVWNSTFCSEVFKRKWLSSLLVP